MWQKLKLGIVLFLSISLWLGVQTPVSASTLSFGTSRIYGQREIDTAIAVSQAGWAQSQTAILATTDNFPDALVAAPLSHKLDAPILLNHRDGLDPAVLTELKRLQVNHVIILGGEVVLGPNVVTDLQKAGLTYERIGGLSQYDTAAKVAEKVGTSGQVILANGELFPDALAISAYAGATNTPVLLTNKQGIPQVIKDEYNKLGGNTNNAIIVGGEAVVPSGTLGGIAKVTRVAGWDQYETASAIFKFAQNKLTSNTSYMVTGDNFPDALVAGALAAKNNSEILMSTTSTLSPVTYTVLTSPSATGHSIVFIGGPRALSDQVKGMVEGGIPVNYPLAGRRIVVDPGHGTPDTGAIGFSRNTYEKDDNLAMAYKLVDLLHSSGAQVYMTRTGDASPAASNYNLHDDLWDRVNYANDLNADLFISVHSNGASSPSAYGTETLYTMYPQWGTQGESQKLAVNIQSELIKNIGVIGPGGDRGVIQFDGTVLNRTKMAAVIVEPAFISNQTEEKLLASDSFRQKVATGIYKGILDYYGN